MIARAAALVLAGGLAACHTLSARECHRMDWAGRGQADAAHGLASRLAEYRDDCASHGVRGDEAAYARGYAAGLQWLCRPQGAYVSGRRGDGYEGICPADRTTAFAIPYRYGRAVHERVLSLQQRQWDLDQLRLAQLTAAPADVDGLRQRLAMGEALYQRQRAALLNLDRRSAAEFGVAPLDEAALDSGAR